jgi:hypothetical protein
MKNFIRVGILFLATALGAYSQNTLAGNLTVQQTIKYTGVQTPAQITADVNDYAPTNVGIASALRLSTDQANRTITGLVPGSTPGGRLMWLLNTGSYPIIFANESASSTAANRFALGVNFSLAAGSTLPLWYDVTSSRWRPQNNLSTAEVGTVQSVSVVTANGVSGSVATATTTPAITLTLGAITPSSVAAAGTVTGSNLSGTNTGDQTTITGNAGTATALQTARDINGVAFDGTQNITVTAAAGTLTGTTLAANVVNSSLTGAAGGAFGTAAYTAATAYATATQGALADTAIQAADLGTAAYEDIGFFATAAQGATADTAVQPARTISTTSPLSGGGDLSANRTLTIADAAADGTTKGAASFLAADFDASSGLVSLDYTNGQAASGSLKGFLTSADWTTFSSKQAGDAALTALAGGSDFVAFSGPATSIKTFTLPNASSTIYTTASTSAYTALPFTLASGTLLGRMTALAGTVEEITPGTSLSFGSGALNTIQDIRTSASPTFAGLTLSSPLSAANGGTGLSSLGSGVATFLGTPSSANLRSALTDEVGTGAAYFVGGALGTPASGTVTNLTGTASININGTVGATTPSTGAFTTLSATGRITRSGAASIWMDFVRTDSTTATGAIRFLGSDLVSDWEIGTNEAVGAVFEINQAGNNRFQVTSTGINSTAVGATTPSTGAFTSVTGSSSTFIGSTNTVGTFKTSNLGSYGALQIKNATANGEASIGFRDDSDSDETSWVIGKSVNSADVFGWYYGGARMSLSTGGSLSVNGGINSTAIGATTPSTVTGTTIVSTVVMRLKNYTVATLPAGTQGDTAYVTDALAPTYLATIVGGGAIVTPVFYNGTNWVAH